MILSGIALAGICTVLLSLTFHVLFLVLIYSIVMSVAMSGASVITTGACCPSGSGAGGLPFSD